MADAAYDLIVIGGGPGGYVAAIRAAQLGMKTAVVEREALGGICLNWGCIPTKALLRTSEIRHLLGRLDRFGFEPIEPRFDMAKVVRRSREIADRLSKGVAFLLKKNAVDVVDGEGRLAGAGRVAVTRDGGESDMLEAANIVVATGARPKSLPGIEPDGDRIWTYREAMVPETMPNSVLVIGSGAIGIEFASFYRLMGAEVTVVEILDRILPAEDAEISALAHRAFERQGIDLHVATRLENLDLGNRKEVVARLVPKDGEASEVRAERVVLAVGIAGNVEDLGLEEAGVGIEKGHIVTDGWGATAAEGVYAIGDVTGPPWLAHKAMHEGVACVEHIAGHESAHPLDPGNVPGCTYCWPQIASVGLTEEAAKEAGHEVRVGRFPYRANGKALALDEPEGLIKTVFDAKSGALLGAHMIGAEVTELIQGFAVARTLETTEAELMATVFPHPTLSEAMHEAVLDAYGRALHI